MQSLYIEPTQECNLNCLTCARTKASAEAFEGNIMSMRTFSNLRPYMGNLKVFEICGFGEPLLHPSIIEFMKLAKEWTPKKCEIKIRTNGLPLDRTMVEAMEGIIDDLQISIDGIESNKRVRGVDIGVMARKIDMVHDVTKKPKVSIAFVLMRSNMPELTDLVDFADEHDIRVIRVQPLIVHEKSMRAENIYRHRREALTVLKKTIEKASSKGIELMFCQMDEYLSTKTRTCDMPFKQLQVSWNGAASMCCSGFVIGNINENSREEILNVPFLLRLRENLERGDIPGFCRRCTVMRNTIKNQEAPTTMTHKVFKFVFLARHEGLGKAIKKAKKWV